ncbi:MAG TPA: VOC family protein [Rhodocyclaceae bacterium]|nr:VOC family protein [Rhodocyclaceae bacterium]
MVTVQAIPPGMHALTPHLICRNAAAAIDFYVKAFGAKELARLPGPDGKVMHAMLKIGDSTLMLADEYPQTTPACPQSAETLHGSPVILHLYVSNADTVAAQAVEAGAKVLMPVEDMFWGDRYGRFEDPFGHQWSIATHVRDVTQEEMNAAMKKMAAEQPAGKTA